MRDTFIKTFSKMIKKNKKLMLVTADLGFGVLDNFIKKYPNNFINVGVAEQNMIGIATGLSKKGFNVFVYSLGNFPTLRCLEQIRNDAAYHAANIKIVNVGGGFSYGQLGFSHHATEDLSIMRAIPEVNIISPFDELETEQATKFMAMKRGLFYFRLDKKRKVSDHITSKKRLKKNKFIFGKMSLLIDGKDIIIFSIGGIVNDLFQVCKKLNDNNIYPSLVSCHTLKPLDNIAIKRLCNDNSKIFVVEENSKIGGLASGIADVCMNNSIKPKVFQSYGIENKFIKEVGDREHLLKISKIDSSSLYKKIRNSIK